MFVMVCGRLFQQCDRENATQRLPIPDDCDYGAASVNNRVFGASSQTVGRSKTDGHLLGLSHEDPGPTRYRENNGVRIHSCQHMESTRLIHAHR